MYTLEYLKYNTNLFGLVGIAVMFVGLVFTAFFIGRQQGIKTAEQVEELHRSGIATTESSIHSDKNSNQIKEKSLISKKTVESHQTEPLNVPNSVSETDRQTRDVNINSSPIEKGTNDLNDKTVNNEPEFDIQTHTTQSNDPYKKFENKAASSQNDTFNQRKKTPMDQVRRNQESTTDTFQSKVQEFIPKKCPLPSKTTEVHNTTPATPVWRRHGVTTDESSPNKATITSASKLNNTSRLEASNVNTGGNSASKSRRSTSKYEEGVVRFVNDSFGFIIRNTHVLPTHSSRKKGPQGSLFFTVNDVNLNLAIQRGDVVGYKVQNGDPSAKGNKSKPKATEIELLQRNGKQIDDSSANHHALPWNRPRADSVRERRPSLPSAALSPTRHPMFGSDHHELESFCLGHDEMETSTDGDGETSDGSNEVYNKMPYSYWSKNHSRTQDDTFHRFSRQPPSDRFDSQKKNHYHTSFRRTSVKQLPQTVLDSPLVKGRKPNTASEPDGLFQVKPIIVSVPQLGSMTSRSSETGMSTTMHSLSALASPEGATSGSYPAPALDSGASSVAPMSPLHMDSTIVKQITRNVERTNTADENAFVDNIAMGYLSPSAFPQT